MRYLTGWLLMPAAATVVFSIAATGAEAGSRHIRKHQHGVNFTRTPVRSVWREPSLRDPTLRDSRLSNSWATGEVRTIGPPRRAGSACPGSGRAIDCTVWPPPIDDDPDRQIAAFQQLGQVSQNPLQGSRFFTYTNHADVKLAEQPWMFLHGR